MLNKIVRSGKLSNAAITAFFITFAVCTALISVMMWNRASVEKLTMEQLILEKSIKIHEVLTGLLYKTHTLAALTIQSDGHIEDFNRVARTIADDPAVINVLVAPDGVVSEVYPLAGNEAVLGLDFFSEGAGNKEAAMAVESGALVLGGPFELVQGGQALVGRLPVTVGGEFWGLVSVTLKYPEALEKAGLDALQKQGLAYEIWRIDPDSGEKQIIDGSGYDYNEKAHYAEKRIDLANAVWYFRVLPIRVWYEYPEMWLLLLVVACASLLVAAIVQNNHDLGILKLKLEGMAYEDPLIGISNRRFFMEAARKDIERADKADAKAFIIIFDLDYFKEINDSHGHSAGDEVLADVAQRVKGMIRPYDLFARYGGEEFILLVTNIDERAVKNLVERFRRAICETPVVLGDLSIPVSASFGVAPVSGTLDLEQTIKSADEALYRAKAEGRNRAAF